MRRAHNFKDLTDKTFGRLYVKEFAYTNKKGAYWKCNCICENKCIILGSRLRNGHTKSCGCLNIEKLGARYKGKNLSEEHRRKIAKSHKGLLSGKKHPMYGKKHSKDSLRRMSNVKEGKYIREDNPNWDPNLTDEDRVERRLIPRYKEWTQEVYKLDNYTCRKCEQRGKYLNAHHIESYRANPELRTEVSNGITLCETCHKDFHHQYGYGNNTRAQLIEFLNKEARGC